MPAQLELKRLGNRVLAVRFALAAIWLTFGLVFKVLGGVPRHQSIVARVLGEDLARGAIVAIGLGECLLGLWVLSGKYPRVCAAAQTGAIVTMNTLEIVFARDLLVSPGWMLAANGLLLAAAWWSATR